MAIRKSLGLVTIGAMLFSGVSLFAQNGPPAGPGPVPAQPSEPQILTPDQLDNLVAPIALYPDPLLGQVLAASTYPLEVVEAQQWLQQNGNLKGQQLMDAARQQNWDPSVAALVAFPDVLTMLNRDVQWTTDLGNAFLAQQKDVMAAVQRMRSRAQQNGKLTSTAQETVTTQTQDGQQAIQIEPANPQVVYVPVYNPAYVWGPPLYGYYPPLWYPSYGFGWGPGIYLGGFFPGWGIGWGGWGLGWGWGCGWFGGGLYVNAGFFSHWGFRGYYGGGFYGGGYGRMAWAHDAFHRAGVPYGNSAVAARYNNSRFAAGRYSAGSASFAGRNSFAGRSSYAGNARSSFNGAARSNGAAGGWQHFNGNANASRGAGQSYRGGAANSYSRGGAQSYGRSYSAPNASRGYSGGQNFSRGYSAPNASRGYSGGSRSYASPRSSGGGFSGGHSGGFSGGGHSSGGGHASGGGHGGRR